MKQNKIYNFICYIWFLVPVLSLVILNKPLITVRMGAGLATVAAMPELEYNGFQLLTHGNLVNDYNEIVADMCFELILLKILIAAQVNFDVILISISLWEWRKTKKFFLWIRGILSIGYVLTAFVIYRFVQIFVHNRKWHPGRYGSYIRYFQSELEINILFSIGVVILFIITLLLYKKR